MSAHFARLVALLSIVPLAFSLAGCLASLPEATALVGDVRSSIAKGATASPRGATIAIASLEGAPPALEGRFRQLFAKESADREIAMTDPSTAYYLVKGYLNAYAAEQGTDIAYVYDIFDANSQTRIGRVEDVLTLPGTNPDAWALVDDRVMASLAGRSADSLASALAATPAARTAAASIPAGEPALRE